MCGRRRGSSRTSLGVARCSSLNQLDCIKESAAGAPAGSNECWPNCGLRCGSETRRDPGQTSTQARDGLPGCAPDPALAAGRSFPEDPGAELGESRLAATVVGTGTAWCSAHSNHEPIASVARCKKRPWREAGREQLESFALAPWASRRPLRGPGVFKPRDLSRRIVLKPLPRITVNPPCQTGHN